MKKGFFALLVAISLSFSPTAHAGDVWQMAESEAWGEKFGGMLGRGLLNVASSFVDLFVQTVEGTQEGPALVGTMKGIAGGASCTVLRAGSGIVDIVGSWVPDFNGVPVARSYSNCLDQEAEYYTGNYGTDSGNAAAASKASSNYGAVRGDAKAAASSAKKDVSSRVDKTGKTMQKHDPNKYVK